MLVRIGFYLGTRQPICPNLNPLFRLPGPDPFNCALLGDAYKAQLLSRVYKRYGTLRNGLQTWVS